MYCLTKSQSFSVQSVFRLINVFYCTVVMCCLNLFIIAYFVSRLAAFVPGDCFRARLFYSSFGTEVALNVRVLPVRTAVTMTVIVAVLTVSSGAPIISAVHEQDQIQEA